MNTKPKIALRMLWRFCLGLVILTVLSIGLLVSPIAPPLVKWALTKHITDLQIEAMSGSVLTGLHITSLRYQYANTQLDVSSVDIEIDWNCAHFKQICITELLLNGISVAQTSKTQTTSLAATDKQEDEPSNTLFTSPIAVNIAQLQLSALAINTPEFTASAQQLQSSVYLAEKLTFNNTQLEQFKFNSKIEPKASPPFTGLRYSAPELPEIWIPIIAEFNAFTARDLAFSNPQQTHNIKHLYTELFTANGTTLNWSKLKVKHDKGEIETSGQTSLSHVYPTSLSVTGTLLLDDNQQQTITMETTGSLYELNFEAMLSGLVNGNAKLTLNLLYDDLPIDGQISWQEQTLNYKHFNTLKAGHLNVAGTMDGYQLIIDSAADIEQLNDVSFIADVALSGSTLSINQLDANLLGGAIVTAGKLDFINGIDATGSTTVSNIDVTQFIPSISAAAMRDASWQYVIQQSDTGLVLLLSQLNGVFALEQHDIDIQGQVAYHQAQDILVADLAAKQTDADNSLSLLAQIFNKQRLNVQSHIAMNNLTKLLPSLNGQVSGKVDVHGKWQDPIFDIQLQLDNGTVDAALSQQLNAQQTIAGKLALNGQLSAHQLTLSSKMKDYATQIQSVGGMRQGHYIGELNTATLGAFNTNWSLAQPVPIRYQQQKLKVNDLCWQLNNSDADVCFDDIQYTKSTAQWDARANKLPIGPWLQAVLPQLTDVTDSALLSATSTGKYSSQQGLSASLGVQVAESIWTFNDINPVPIRLRQLAFAANLSQQTLTGRAVVSSDEVGFVSADFTTQSQSILDGKIKGELTIDNVDLGPLSNISPSIYDLAGLVNGKVTISGEAKRPTLHGALNLTNGVVDIEQSPLLISNWKQTFVFTGQQAQIQGSYAIGDGNGELDGLLSWQNDPYGKLNVNAQQILLEHEQSVVRVSPHLSASITATETKVSGNIDIPYARIKLKQLPQNAVTPSRDVHIWGEGETTDPLKQIDFDIGVNIGDKQQDSVRLDAFGLTANLQGQLQLQNQPSLVGYGDLQILDGRYKAYGQDLQIRRGEVQFNGPLSEPLLFVEAIRDPLLTEDDVIAGVRIDGVATGPTVSLFSEPAMDQGANLLYLINGSGSFARGESTDTDYGALLLGLGLSQSGNITNSIGKSLGIEDLSFSTRGQGSNSQISLSGNITRDLSLRVGVGLSKGQEVAIRYRILPQLYIEAVQQLSTQVSLIDLFYQFSLGDPVAANQKLIKE